MNTHTVKWQTYKGGPITHVEIVSEPITFEQAEAHLELGNSVFAIRQGVPYHLFTGQGSGPGFVSLWRDVTWHIVVRVWP